MNVTMKMNRVLAVLAAVLFLLSFLSFRESVNRAERFERGQKFLANLNPDEISRIVIAKGENTTELERRDDEFLVASNNGYPADTSSVNRFIKDVLKLGLEKKVGDGTSLEEELELTPGGENTTEVAFTDGAGNEMVRFLVGKSSDGGGNYVRRTDAAEGEKNMIFLTSSQVYLTTDGDSYLQKQILDVEDAEIASVRGAGFVMEEQEGTLKLVDVPVGKKESSKASQLKRVLSGLHFTKHHLANDPKVSTLRYDAELRVGLKDGSGYVLTMAESEDTHYLVVQAFHDETGQLSISMEASVEEVKETSEVLVRQEEVQDFNELHGSWVYEVSEGVADKVRVAARDLVEDA
jgi:hypothetical protein